MALTRRRFLTSASAFAGLSATKQTRASIGRDAVPIGRGWNTLPLGAGGLVTGLHIARDGSMVCRTDVGNIYRWSGKSTDYADGSKSWLPLLNFTSLGSSASIFGFNSGAWEHVLAPGNSAVHLAIFYDTTSQNKTQRLWYSTNSGGTWRRSNVVFSNLTAMSNDNATKLSYYKIAIDPVNENVAYCGMPHNSGNSAGVYTSLNQSGGSTLATWTAVRTNGLTAIGAPTSTGVMSAGLAIDTSLGATTIGGQTVSKHIILPVGGVGIYESTDGGQTFTEIALSAFGTSGFWVTNGAFTAGGVYYCVVISSTAFGVWRYASATWTNITPTAINSKDNFFAGAHLIVDPRSAESSQSYLSFTGPNGIGAGFTSTNANSRTPTWTGLTNQEFPYLLAAPYDIPYLNFIFGQQARNAFANGTSACVDADGNCFWAGNQSLFYFGISTIDSTPSGPPHYADTSFPATFPTYSWSMGRGQEATVSQDALCPPGGTYPILAAQDLGAPMRGTFTSYPEDLGVHFQEYDCSSLEFAANDPSFIVACTTGQQVNVTNYLYSTNYGADGSWHRITRGPDSFWNGRGLGVQGGHLVAVDHDHWIAVPQGNGSSKYQPAFTSNATGGASWSLCSGLPAAAWTMVSWVFASHTSKPFAVGYGADQGTVWACLFVTGSSTASLYRSTDAGATWSSVAKWTISAATVAVYCLSVPDYPSELWITGSYTGGQNTNLWHITNANSPAANVTPVALPANATLPIAFTLGAPSSPVRYPALYLLGWAGYGQTPYLYKGSWDGVRVSWSLFGPTGTSKDLPVSCQLCGIQALRGDWNVHQRLYVSSQQSGFAYYNP